MYSKFCLAFLLILTISSVFCSEDLLSKRIIRYNKIEEQRIVVDSSKVFFNLKLLHLNQSNNTNVEIIKARNQLIGNYSFFWLLFSLFSFSLIRYRAGSSYWQLFSNFFSFKNNEGEQLSLIKILLIGIAFISLFSYFAYLLIQSHTYSSESKSLFISIVYSVVFLLLYRFIVFNLVKYIFQFSAKTTGYQFVVFDLMYIFVFISLPTLFLASLINVHLRNIVLIGVLALFVFCNAYMYYKIAILNSHLLTRNVFKTIIYFYVVEIIPILLFLKYLKLL